MASRNRDADFSSSPAHPSHHRTRVPKPAPEASTSRNLRKRTASQAEILTPPGSPSKSKPRSAKRTFSDSEDEDEEMESPSGKGKNMARGGRGRNTRPVAKERRAQGRSGVDEGSAGRTRQSLRRKSSRVAMAVDSPDSNLDSPAQPKTPTGGDVVGELATLRLPPEPTTPTTIRRSKRNLPVRDSPNNPFLGSGSPKAALSRPPVEEQPTMTYVFRGVKAVFRNPAYDGPNPSDRQYRDALGPAHPDFSPDLITKPKLLWASGPAEDSDDETPAPARTTSPSPSRRGPTKRRRIAKEGDVFNT